MHRFASNLLLQTGSCYVTQFSPGVNLRAAGVVNLTLPVQCNQASGTRRKHIHTFQNYESPVVQGVWKERSTWAQCPCSDPAGWDTSMTMQAWVSSIAHGSSNTAKGLRSLTMLVIWAIWKERKGSVFRSVFTPPGRRSK